MSEEQVNETPKEEPVAEQTPATPPTETPPEQKIFNLSDLQLGYVIGVKEDGNFMFDIVGKQPTLVGLLGLHKFAESKIKNVLDANENQGDKLLLDVARTVAVLAQEMSKLANSLKKPDNLLKR